MPDSLPTIWASLGIPADYAEARQLPIQREAQALITIGRTADRRLIKLTPSAAAAWRRLHAAAARADIALRPISGFRSIARQTAIIRRKLAAGNPLAEILKLVAAPGCSEHHTGCAIDISTPEDPSLEEHFARTPAFRWLKKNAGRFGFYLSYPRRNRHRIGYEPWHWCWRPTGRQRPDPA